MIISASIRKYDNDKEKEIIIQSMIDTLRETHKIHPHKSYYNYIEIQIYVYTDI